MVSFHQLARKNRQRNAGGCYPDALPHAVTLAILLRKLARESPHDRPGMTVVALFLWLTQAWSESKMPRIFPTSLRFPVQHLAENILFVLTMTARSRGVSMP